MTGRTECGPQNLSPGTGDYVPFPGCRRFTAAAVKRVKRKVILGAPGRSRVITGPV